MDRSFPFPGGLSQADALEKRLYGVLKANDVSDAGANAIASALLRRLRDLEEGEDLSAPFPLFKTLEGAHKHAKKLHKELLKNGVPIKLSKSQILFAQYYAFKDWQTFKAVVEKFMANLL
jgi:hypothetical protein